jgi:ribA/ribD-fused uncharacterized protein
MATQGAPFPATDDLEKADSQAAAQDVPSAILTDQDSAEMTNIAARTAYVNLRGTNLMTLSEKDLMLKLASSNANDRHPYAAYMVKRGVLKLIFDSELKRNQAVIEKLNFDELRLDVEKPYRETGLSPSYRRVVHLFGIPIFETNDRVAVWLRSFGLDVIGDVRMVKHAGTEIFTTRRSALLSVPKGHTIPGYAYYAEPQERGPRVQFWWPNMTKCCRRCWRFGHVVRDCTMVLSATAPSDPDDAMDVAAESDLPLPPSPMPPVPSGLTVSDATFPSLVPVPSFDQDVQLDKEYDNFTKFFTKKSEFSNHFECSFEIDGNKYCSTEQYLFSAKANHVGEEKIAAEIMASTTGAKAKELGERVQWPAKDSWKEMGYRWLWTANHAKYIQNPELLQKLKDTKGTRLVECNPHDCFWGIGLSENNPASSDRKKWRGRNMFGDLLTHLRRWLVFDEGASVVRKRGRVTPSGVSPEAKR